MAADDLSAPLGREPISKRKKFPVSPARLLIGACGLVLAAFAGWALMVDDPQGGEPGAVAQLPAHPSPAAKADTAMTRPEVAAHGETPAASTSGDGRAVVTIIDGSTGKRQEVKIPASEPKPDGAQLLESTRHGMVPKIGADGTRPLDAYAIARDDEAATDTPRIAIVVTGLGIGAKITDAAIAKLPGAVTLAFVPYGQDVGTMATKARAAGHEMLLQVPMEPLDYPDNDPGPQTLLTTLPADQNIDRLHWVMSRLRGYVGIASYMGGRFTATEMAVAPVLKEAGKRGLVYFDDGSSARSVTAQITGANNITFAKADIVIDAVPTATDIGKALMRLETAARANGSAVGVVSALPVSIERLAQWTKGLKGRGFELVPISVAATRPKSS